MTLCVRVCARACVCVCAYTYIWTFYDIRACFCLTSNDPIITYTMYTHVMPPDCSVLYSENRKSGENVKVELKYLKRISVCTSIMLSAYRIFFPV